jgi:two-component system response regulator (stage 0 sporulation protein F)
MNPLFTILYIDDEPINLMLFVMNFKKEFNVITGKTGEEGLDKLRTISGIHVVISDMKMPGMNGIEFINKARADFPDIVYFILTGYDISDEIDEALNNKVIHRFFRKPFDMKEIRFAIQEALNQK